MKLRLYTMEKIPLCWSSGPQAPQRHTKGAICVAHRRRCGYVLEILATFMMFSWQDWLPLYSISIRTDHRRFVGNFKEKLRKKWTLETLVEFFPMRKPIGEQRSKPQTGTVKSLWFWGFPACPELFCNSTVHNWFFIIILNEFMRFSVRGCEILLLGVPTLTSYWSYWYFSSIIAGDFPLHHQRPHTPPSFFVSYFSHLINTFLELQVSK